MLHEILWLIMVISALLELYELQLVENVPKKELFFFELASIWLVGCIFSSFIFIFSTTERHLKLMFSAFMLVLGSMFVKMGLIYNNSRRPVANYRKLGLLSEFGLGWGFVSSGIYGSTLQ